MDSALIRSLATLAPTLLGPVIANGYESLTFFFEQTLDVLENQHTFCSRQYAQNIIADDDVVMPLPTPIRRRAMKGVVVIPFLWIQFKALPTPIIQHLYGWARSNVSMFQ
jgi:hypothetical protein